jgi:hypothetical protein
VRKRAVRHVVEGFKSELCRELVDVVGFDSEAR